MAAGNVRLPLQLSRNHQQHHIGFRGGWSRGTTITASRHFQRTQFQGQPVGFRLDVPQDDARQLVGFILRLHLLQGRPCAPGQHL